MWDVRATVDGGRDVHPAEQHIHSFLESLPFMAMPALLCLHWDQIAGVRQAGPDPRHGSRAASTCPPVTWPRAGRGRQPERRAVCEELWRCARARKR